MSEFQLQQFLALMDTIHDYGKTSRTTKPLYPKKGKTAEPEDEDDSNEEDNNGRMFNKAVFLDFLMLALLQKYFKENIGLTRNQHYLSKESDCLSGKTLDSALARDICLRFYYPTFENRIVFRSSHPEDIARDVLFADKGYKEDSGFENTFTHNHADYRDTLLSTYALRIYDTSYDNTVFVLDANSLDNECFGRVGKGLFQVYDSAPKTKNNETNGNIDLSKALRTMHRAEYIKCDYILQKTAGELNFLNTLGTITLNGKQFLRYESEKGKTYDVNLDDELSGKFRQGLSLFVQLINAINEKTLGVRKLGKNDKEELKEKLERLGIEVMRIRYSVYLKTFEKELSDNERKSCLILDKEDFVKALFDFKRAMDYLYVKACKVANDEAKKANQLKKYIFVSSDRSAIYYALNLNCPCILTSPAKVRGPNKGTQEITFYNPEKAIKQNVGPQANNNINPNAIKKAVKLYEIQDDVDLLANQLQVNEEMINKEKQKAKDPMKQDELIKLEKDADCVYNELYKLQETTKDRLKKPETANAAAMKSMLKRVDILHEAVKLTSPVRPKQKISIRPRAIVADPGAGPGPAPKELDVSTMLEEMINKVNNIQISADELSEMLNEKSCRRWLTRYVNEGAPKYPHGLAQHFNKEDNYSETIKDYCIRKHNLQEFYNKLMEGKNKVATGGWYAHENPCFYPDIKKAGQELNDIVTNYDCNDTKEKILRLLDEEISLTYDNEPSTQFGEFLNAYSILSPTISFFWYIVFKTLYFHIEKD